MNSFGFWCKDIKKVADKKDYRRKISVEDTKIFQVVLAIGNNMSWCEYIAVSCI